MINSKRSQARSAARLATVQALYQHQMEGTVLAKLIDEFHQHRLGREIEEDEYGGQIIAEAEVDFFDDLVRGVCSLEAEIDKVIELKLANGWTLSRVDKTMLQILRAGTYELMRRADVPTPSVINEYVEVAKAFFNDRESKFVNGILDSVAKEMRS